MEYNYKQCQSTQSPEKFICLNRECCFQEKKQVHCYQCLTKLHLSKNKVIRHVDEFMEISELLQILKKKHENKLLAFQILEQQAIEMKKEKLQEVELNKQSNAVKQATQKIEDDVNKFVTTLNHQLAQYNPNVALTFQEHSRQMKLYYENLDKTIQIETENLEHLIVEIEHYIQQLELNINSIVKKLTQKYQLLEKQVNQQEKQTKYLNLIYLVIIILVPYLFVLQKNQIELLDNSSIIQEQINQLKNEFSIYHSQQKEHKSQLHQFFNYSSQNENQLSQMNVSYIDLLDKVEKLKIRFEAYKKSSSQNINQLQEQAQNIVLQLIPQKFLTITSIIEYIQNKIIQFQEQFLQNEYKLNLIRLIQQKNELIGKIHQNLNIQQLVEFEKIYDENFTFWYTAQKNMEILSYIYDTNDINVEAIICLGALHKNNTNNLILAACDLASEVFNNTFNQFQARKSKNGDIYWYRIDGMSFGFATTEEIELFYCDDWNATDDRRLSYWFNMGHPCGGRRVGTQRSLDNKPDYRLQIYLLKV